MDLSFSSLLRKIKETTLVLFLSYSRVNVSKKIFSALILTLLLLLNVLSSTAFADVVKPALIEINVNQKGEITIEVRASIEALLTGINGRFKNTKDSPRAAEYDVLRKMQSEQLTQAFKPFETQFLESIKLSDDEKHNVKLSIREVKIPEPGYTKVPRISFIKLKGQIDTSITTLQWYYPMSFGDNAVRLRQVDLAKQKFHWSEWQWLRKDQASEPFSLTEIVAKKPLYKTIASFIELGFVHILPLGTDHILFILGLFLFSTAIRPLLWQVTMFTIAHTITLGLAMNGIITLPANIVEPLIALSIAYVGIENVYANLHHKVASATINKGRLLLVFLFGLLHGLGFASALADFKMPEDAFVTALISFNVGVELGQLSVILGAFLFVAYWFSKEPWYNKVVTIPASLLISAVAFFWFIERLDLNFIS